MGTIYLPEYPPASAHASDDEFADAAGAGAPSGWTEVDHGSTVTVSEDEDGLVLTQPTQGAPSWAGVYKAVPANDWTFQTKMELGGKSLTNFLLAGIALFQDATSSSGDIYTHALRSAASDVEISINRWSAYNAFLSTAYAVALSTDDGPSFAWLRVRYTHSTTTFSFDYGFDGIGWFQAFSSSSIGFAPAHVGLAISNEGTTINAKAVFYHARFAATNIGPLALIGGQRVSTAHATSGGLFLPQAPPNSANASDDEFDDSSVSGSWTEYDHGSTTTVSEDAAGLILEQTTHATTGKAGVYKAVPAGAWTITTRVSIDGILSAGAMWGGLAVFENPTSSTGNLFMVELGLNSTVSIVRAEIYTAYDTRSTTQSATLGTTIGPAHLWLRLRYSGAGTTYTPQYSFDGVGWLGMTAVDVGYTATHVGLISDNENNGTTFRARFSSFRVQGSDVGYSGLSLGDRIQTVAA